MTFVQFIVANKTWDQIIFRYVVWYLETRLFHTDWYPNHCRISKKWLFPQSSWSAIASDRSRKIYEVERRKGAEALSGEEVSHPLQAPAH